MTPGDLGSFTKAASINIPCAPNMLYLAPLAFTIDSGFFSDTLKITNNQTLELPISDPSFYSKILCAFNPSYKWIRMDPLPYNEPVDLTKLAQMHKIPKIDQLDIFFGGTHGTYVKVIAPGNYQVLYNSFSFVPNIRIFSKTGQKEVRMNNLTKLYNAGNFSSYTDLSLSNCLSLNLGQISPEYVLCVEIPCDPRNEIASITASIMIYEPNSDTVLFRNRFIMSEYIQEPVLIFKIENISNNWFIHNKKIKI